MSVGICLHPIGVSRVAKIYASYQEFGTPYFPCGRVKAELKDFRNMLRGGNDYFVMHFWRDNRMVDDHCISVWRKDKELEIAFYADWLGGYIDSYIVPIDHQIEIGGGPNHERGSRDYNSLTWYIHDKTTNEYIEETRDTPAMWTYRNVDVTLEMVRLAEPKRARKAMAKIVALDKNLEPMHLPSVFAWGEWLIPDGYNHHNEIYSHDGYEVECGQWKSISFLYWFRLRSKCIRLGHVIAIVRAYKGKKDIGFKPTLDNLIDVVRSYRKTRS